jgi:hypothetical protein
LQKRHLFYNFAKLVSKMSFKFFWFFCCFVVLTALTSDNNKTVFKHHLNSDSILFCAPYHHFSSQSEQFKKYSDSLYNVCFDSSTLLKRKVFDLALKGYFKLAQKGFIKNDRFLSIIDYSLSANDKRLWVIDLMTQKVVFNEWVAHGKNSGELYAKKFSNTKESFQSSIGFYVTGELYQGTHDWSLKLIGLEKSINHLALERGIVIHGANYVSERFIKENQRLGRSLGCPAVHENIVLPLIQTIKEGACLFAYYPQAKYLKYSTVLKGN